MKKAIILARVSTEDQFTEGHSIPAQLAKAREYAERRDLEVVSEHQFDESSIKDHRAKFERVIEEIETSNEPLALIVETIDRLQRSFKESVQLDTYRKSGKLEIHFIRENLIISQESNSSEIQRWDLGVFLAKSYVLQISDNVKRSIKHKIDNGEFCGKPPFGYHNITLEDKKKWIEPHPFRSRIVKQCFSLYATGAYSMQQIGRKVKEEFGVDFRKGRVDYVLKQPFYHGEMLHKGIIYPHKYETIISRETFDLVQDIKSEHHKKPFKYAGLPYLYRGLVRCGKCGCSFSPEKKKSKYVYYHCTEYHDRNRGGCNKKWIREEELTKQFAQYFESIKIPDGVVEEISQMLKDSHKGKVDCHKETCKTLEDQYERLERRIERMYEDHLDKTISKDFFDKKREEYRRQQKNIRTRIDRLEGTDEGYYITGTYLIQLANKAAQIFESSEPEIKKQLIKLVLQNPVVNDATLTATIRNPFNVFAEGASSSKWLPRVDSNHGPID
jgi:site-specific DNA recombinase